MSVRHSADQGQTVATAYMKVCHISFMVLLPQWWLLFLSILTAIFQVNLG